MESTTSKSPIKEKAVIAAFLAVITALTSIPNDAKAAAPRPTYEFYGTDTKEVYVMEDAGTIIPVLLHAGVWVLESRETHRFVKPGSRRRLESVATRIFIWPKGTQETYGRIRPC